MSSCILLEIVRFRPALFWGKESFINNDVEAYTSIYNPVLSCPILSFFFLHHLVPYYPAVLIYIRQSFIPIYLNSFHFTARNVNSLHFITLNSNLLWAMLGRLVLFSFFLSYSVLLSSIRFNAALFSFVLLSSILLYLA